MHFIFNRNKENSQAEVISNTPKRAPELSTLMASSLSQENGTTRTQFWYDRDMTQKPSDLN